MNGVLYHNLHSCEEEKMFYNCIKNAEDDPEFAYAIEHFTFFGKCYIQNMYHVNGCVKDGHQPIAAAFPRCIKYSLDLHETHDFQIVDTNYFQHGWEYTTVFRGQNFKFNV